MAHDVHRPHDKLFRTVFADQRQAAGLLQAHLPESIAGHLRWSSLALQDRTFVDDDLLDSESDLLFSIKRTAGHPAWLYVLLEHQSRPDRWMPFRLLRILPASMPQPAPQRLHSLHQIYRRVAPLQTRLNP